MIYMSLCGSCAASMRQTRTMVESSSAYAGRCPMCMREGRLIQYELGLSHREAERKRIRERAAAQSGGGERSRAGGRRR